MIPVCRDLAQKKNTAKMIYRLPSLPTELQVVILKSSFSPANDTSAVHREFAKVFGVQRKNVEMWLDFLVIYHSDYQDVVIDQERLSELPGNDTVIDAFGYYATILRRSWFSNKPMSALRDELGKRL